MTALSVLLPATGAPRHPFPADRGSRLHDKMVAPSLSPCRIYSSFCCMVCLRFSATNYPWGENLVRMPLSLDWRKSFVQVCVCVHISWLVLHVQPVLQALSVIFRSELHAFNEHDQEGYCAASKKCTCTHQADSCTTYVECTRARSCAVLSQRSPREVNLDGGKVYWAP